MARMLANASASNSGRSCVGTITGTRRGIAICSTRRWAKRPGITLGEAGCGSLAGTAQRLADSVLLRVGQLHEEWQDDAPILCSLGLGQVVFGNTLIRQFTVSTHDAAPARNASIEQRLHHRALLAMSG